MEETAAVSQEAVMETVSNEEEVTLENLTKAQKESDIKDELEKLGEDVLSFIRMEG